MTLYSRSNDKRRIMEEIRMREMDIAAAIASQHDAEGKPHLEREKRVRREIANSNERRRMQSINAGFQSLKTLIPHHDGEKLSKAAILQQTTEHISNLEAEKTKLLAQNAHLKMLLEVSERETYYNESPPPKRKKRDTESSDEGISLTSSIDSDDSNDELQREIMELRRQLDRERWLRIMYEDRLRTMETQIYPERIRHIAAHVQANMHLQTEKAMKRAKISETSEDEAKDDPKTELESSMSRKNLETIVEAIRHLEGDRIMFDERRADEKHAIAHSEESDKESSDQEDTKSDSSGRYSPRYQHHQYTSAVVKQSNFSEKYPIATDLLHRPMQQQLNRPGVIVHKS